MNNTDEGLIVDMLTGMFGDFHVHNEYRHQISFDCPVCSYDIKGLDKGDGKGNLEVNYSATYLNVGPALRHTIQKVTWVG